ncbi:MAG: hypothetical protein JXK93_13505 [Sphaerochaetaceae bacterium]|nr:hypothetical protein [Sphaerochaetaceae bacterium]
MKIRTQMLLVSLAAIALVIGGLYIGADYYLLSGTEEIEQNSIIETDNQFLKLLEYDLHHLSVMTTDWGYWDDTYIFMDDLNQEYIDSNLVDSTFYGTGLNVILYFFPNGTYAYGKAYDLTEYTEVPVPASLLEDIQIRKLIGSGSVLRISTGLINTDEGPMAIAAVPILTSDEYGPMRGSLVMGYYLGDAHIQKLSEYMPSPVVIYSIDDPAAFAGLPQDTLKSYNDRVWIATEGTDTINSVFVIDDIFGEKAFYGRTSMDRDIYRLGLTAMYGFMLTVFVLLIIIYIVVQIILYRKVHRIERLTGDVTYIAEDENYSVRVFEEGKDELTHLSGSVNKLLRTIESTLTDLAASERSLRTSLDEKNVLLGEVHHRVKNNLQIIISMMGMQLFDVKDTAAQSIIRDAINRILSISMVHEQLYQDESVSTIRAQSHFEKLFATVMRNSPPEVKVEHTIDCGSCTMGLDQAVPLSLAIQELLTNSLKYAFTGRDEGNITFKMDCTGKETVVVLSDDGAGFPEDRDPFDRKSVGLSLVHDIVTKQLKGTVELTREGVGTTWIIRIPEGDTIKDDTESTDR